MECNIYSLNHVWAHKDIINRCISTLGPCASARSARPGRPSGPTSSSAASVGVFPLKVTGPFAWKNAQPCGGCSSQPALFVNHQNKKRRRWRQKQRNKTERTQKIWVDLKTIVAFLFAICKMHNGWEKMTPTWAGCFVFLKTQEDKQHYLALTCKSYLWMSVFIATCAHSPPARLPKSTRWIMSVKTLDISFQATSPRRS